MDRPAGQKKVAVEGREVPVYRGSTVITLVYHITRKHSNKSIRH